MLCSTILLLQIWREAKRKLARILVRIHETGHYHARPATRQACPARAGVIAREASPKERHKERPEENKKNE
jgi:hypothetical protein